MADGKEGSGHAPEEIVVLCTFRDPEARAPPSLFIKAPPVGEGWTDGIAMQVKESFGSPLLRPPRLEDFDAPGSRSAQQTTANPRAAKAKARVIQSNVGSPSPRW